MDLCVLHSCVDNRVSSSGGFKATEKTYLKKRMEKKHLVFFGIVFLMTAIH